MIELSNRNGDGPVYRKASQGDYAGRVTILKGYLQPISVNAS